MKQVEKKNGKALEEHLEDARIKLGSKDDIEHKKFLARILDSFKHGIAKIEESQKKRKLSSEIA